MGSFLFNKILGAVLATFLFIFALNEIGAQLFHADRPETPGYAVEIPEEDAATLAEQVVEELPDFAIAIPAASVEAGAQVAKKCLSCHGFEKGGPAKTGPNLWGVLGREAGSHPDYQGRYSDAMQAYDQVWAYENMYAYLENPRSYIEGTAMNFAGLNKERDRLDIIAYLRSLDDDPYPLPAAADAEDPAETPDEPAAGR